MEYRETLTAAENDHDRRLDRVIRKRYSSLSLSWIYRAIRTGRITLNGLQAEASDRVRSGDRIVVCSSFPLAPSARKANDPRQIESDRLKPLIIFENEHILALNKPWGMLVHGDDSLDSLVQSYLEGHLSASLSFKPGPIHRLDRNTTGLILFSRSLLGARLISEAFKKRLVKKTYLAILDGEIDGKVEWNDRLQRSRHKTRNAPKSGIGAQTVIEPLICRYGHTLATAGIVTGRTHQIRVQAAIHGHPLTGDRKYEGSTLLDRYVLHAALLSLTAADFGPDLPIGYGGLDRLFAPLPEKSIVHIDALFGIGTAERIVADLC